jgi:uncharacterized membrane protein
MSSNDTGRAGSGQHLPASVLGLATFFALIATVLSVCAAFIHTLILTLTRLPRYSIYLQLKNYRQVRLQRWVVRILVLVPVYSIASLVSLYSLDAAFFIDAVRDIYEVRARYLLSSPSRC